MVFWAHFGPDAAIELGSVLGVVTREHLMRTGAETERDRNDTEVCICGPKHTLNTQQKPNCTKLRKAVESWFLFFWTICGESCYKPN